MKRIPLISCVLCLLAAVGWVASNPLRWSDEGIQRWLEKATPLGTPLSEVQATVTSRGWFDGYNEGSDGRTKGNFIRGELGKYQGLPFRVSVTAFWEFDEGDRLREIRIWKTVDGL